MRRRHCEIEDLLEEIVEIMAAVQADVQNAADRLNAVNASLTALVGVQPAGVDLTPVTDAATALEATAAALVPAPPAA